MCAAKTDLVWRSFLKNRRKGFRALYEKYYDALLSYAISKLKQMDLAENAVAEIFIKLYTYDRLDEVEQPENWMFTIARNYCLGYVSKENNRKQINDQLFSNASHVQDAQADHLIDKEILHHQIQHALSEINQEIWKMDTQGFNNQEIASRTGISEKTVANRKTEIRKVIRDMYLKINREE
ncbi:MAG: sigma-70 family RNA polymerase sigma factor [Cytophagales bacterium]|nr:sigma-70 family RNA polymerase sigma factor [Cytophagales bacterium]